MNSSFNQELCFHSVLQAEISKNQKCSLASYLHSPDQQAAISFLGTYSSFHLPDGYFI